MVECLLIIAHPDDEIFFFIPFIVHSILRRWTIRLCCLSSGDYSPTGNNPKIGTIRMNELRAVCNHFGIHLLPLHPSNRLPDGPSHTWDPEAVTAAVAAAAARAAAAPTVVATFDRAGVTGHPNHCALHHAVATAPAPWLACPLPPQRWFLRSVPAWRRFIPGSAVLQSAWSDAACPGQVVPTQPQHQPLWPPKAPGAAAVAATAYRTPVEGDERSWVGRFRNSVRLLHGINCGRREGVWALYKGHRSQVTWYRAINISLSVMLRSSVFDVVQPELTPPASPAASCLEAF